MADASNTKVLSAVAYILTWITGLIIFFVAKDDKVARWHAVQAIGLGIVAFLGGIVIGIIKLGMLSFLWYLVVLGAVILLAVKAYQGEKVRLPVIADMADKYA